MGSAGSPYTSTVGWHSFLIIRYHFYFSGLIDYVFPHQPVAFILILPILLLASHTLAIHKQFGLRIISVAKDGHVLSQAFGPVPVRKQMQHRTVAPLALIKKKTVFLHSRQVHNAKIRTVCRSTGVERGRFAQIIKARPDKLSEHKVAIVLLFKLRIGSRSPVGIFQVVRRHMIIFVIGPTLLGYRKLIFATTTNRRSGFTAVYHKIGMGGVLLFIIMGFVIEAYQINSVGQAVLYGRHVPVETGCSGTGRVFPMTNFSKPASYLGTIFFSLLTNFITNAPHDNRRMVPVASYHCLQITF